MAMAFAKTLLSVDEQTATVQPADVTVIGFDGSECMGELQADTNSAGTLDVVIYHAPNTNGPWKALFTFTQVTSETDYTQRIHSDTTNTVIGPCFRCIATIASSGDYDIDVKVFFGSK